MVLMLALLMPLGTLIMLVSHAHGEVEVNEQPEAHWRHLISPQDLKQRSQRIADRRKRNQSWRSKHGSPDHKRAMHLREKDDRRKEPPKQRKPLKVIEELVEKESGQTLPPAVVHDHAIPNVLIFTHYINLLEAEKLEGEDVALKRNVENSIALHPDAQLYFLTDDDCLASIARVMGDETPLLDYFRTEEHGMYKADMCRGAALYEHGGIYLDVDLEARMTLWNVIRSDTTFATPFVHKDSKHPGNFFQAFIGTTPGNPILKRYLELFIDHYQGRLDLKKAPLGVVLLRKAHDEVVGTPDHPKPHAQKPQYFMEMLYDKKKFPKVPPPDRGTRRACHFVVVANEKAPYVVPFYSRTKGSRMCGGAESEKTSKK